MKKQEFDKMMKDSWGDRVENISSNPKRIIIVSERVVYHKYAEVEIDVPDSIKQDDILNWLHKNEFLYEEDISQRIYECKLEMGFGCNKNGMSEIDAVIEQRYDVYCKSQHLEGGHL